jgi:very-short-patch-repair endonuclease
MKTRTPKKLSDGGEAFMLHCRAEGISVVREYRFHPTRKWRFDFACDGGSVDLAIEIDGMGGRHQTIGGYKEDARKFNAAAKLGWRVLHYTTDMVTSGEAIADVLEILGRKPKGIL